MTTATDSYDSPIKGICYVMGGVFVFSVQDVIIKWISGKYPIHEIVLLRSIFAVIPILMIVYLEGGMRLLRTVRQHRKNLKTRLTEALWLIMKP